MDMHPSFLPDVVTDWYLDEVWEDFLPQLSLTQNTSMWCVLTQSSHLGYHGVGFWEKKLTSGKTREAFCITFEILLHGNIDCHAQFVPPPTVFLCLKSA